MTRAPWVLPKPSRAFPAGNVTAVSTTLGWRLVNEQMPAEWTVSLGEANEQLRREVRDLPRAAGRVRRPLAQARRRGLERRASTTTSSCRAGRRPGPRRGHPAGLDRREAGRAEAVVPARTARSPPATPPRSTTARPPCCSARRQRRPIGRRPDRPDRRARGVRGWSRTMFGYAPVEAADRALARAGITWSDVAAVELNEAFAVQSLACVDAWKASTPRSSTPRAARSRSATRSARPAAGSSAPWPPAARVRRPVGRGRDLHRRRPGPGRRAGERDG